MSISFFETVLLILFKVRDVLKIESISLIKGSKLLSTIIWLTFLIFSIASSTSSFLKTCLVVHI